MFDNEIYFDIKRGESTKRAKDISWPFCDRYLKNIATKQNSKTE